MATYILLMTLTPEGQRTALNDPEYLLRVEEAIDLPGVNALGIYAVLGEYDFVTIVEAEDNERMARFSLELGVRARAHITTLPAVPISRLDPATFDRSLAAQAELDPSASDLLEEADTPLQTRVRDSFPGRPN